MMNQTVERASLSTQGRIEVGSVGVVGGVGDVGGVGGVGGVGV